MITVAFISRILDLPGGELNKYVALSAHRRLHAQMIANYFQRNSPFIQAVVWASARKAREVDGEEVLL
jgi:hypothetical protein